VLHIFRTVSLAVKLRGTKGCNPTSAIPLSHRTSSPIVGHLSGRATNSTAFQSVHARPLPSSKSRIPLARTMQQGPCSLILHSLMLSRIAVVHVPPILSLSVAISIPIASIFAFKFLRLTSATTKLSLLSAVIRVSVRGTIPAVSSSAMPHFPSGPLISRFRGRNSPSSTNSRSLLRTKLSGSPGRTGLPRSLQEIHLHC
jgi:hypothetical protein